MIDPNAAVIINISDKNKADKLKIMKRYGCRYIPGPETCKRIKTIIYYKRYNVTGISFSGWESFLYLGNGANVYRLNCNKHSTGVIGEII